MYARKDDYPDRKQDSREAQETPHDTERDLRRDTQQAHGEGGRWEWQGKLKLIISRFILARRRRETAGVGFRLPIDYPLPTPTAIYAHAGGAHRVFIMQSQPSAWDLCWTGRQPSSIVWTFRIGRSVRGAVPAGNAPLRLR